MPAQAVLGSREFSQTHFPEREGELLELPLPQKHPGGHKAQPRLSTPGSLGVHQSWQLCPPLMGAASFSDSVFTRLGLCASRISHIIFMKDVLERGCNNS